MMVKTDHKNKYEIGVFEGGINEVVKAGRKWYQTRGQWEHNITRGQWIEGKKPVLESGYFKGWDDLERAVAIPWEHGIKTVYDMIRQLKKIKLPQPVSVRRTPVYRIENGDEIDYERLRSGQEFWRTCVREQSKGPRMVTILTDATTSASVDTDQIMWRGAAALALTNILEDQGYRVELWCFQHCTYGYTNGRGCFTAVKMKDMGKPLNIGALCCGISGWFYRTALFTAYYAAEHATPDDGLGYPRHGIEPWQRDIITNEPTPIIITNVWSMAAAVQKAGQWLRKICFQEKVPELDYEYAGGGGNYYG